MLTSGKWVDPFGRWDSWDNHRESERQAPWQARATRVPSSPKNPTRVSKARHISWTFVASLHWRWAISNIEIFHPRVDPFCPPLGCQRWIRLQMDSVWQPHREPVFRGPQGYARRRSEVHLRSGEKLLRLCEVTKRPPPLNGQINGGCYIKVGQCVATLGYLLPSEYVDTMRPPRTNTPEIPIREDLNVDVSVFIYCLNLPLANMWPL